MLHVFVETNWVVEYAAPIHVRTREATDLLDRARAGEITPHLPAICLSEAKRKIRHFQPRKTADDVRNYLRWAVLERELDERDRDVVLAALDKLESRAKIELGALDGKLGALHDERNVDVFRLTEQQLEHSVDLSVQLDLSAFDAVVLSGVLGRTGELRKAGVVQTFLFCEKDGDLQPWDRAGKPRDALVELYDPLGIRVLSSFDVESAGRLER